MSSPEQFLAAQKASANSAFGVAMKYFEGIERLVELNLQTARSTLAQTADNTAKVLSAKEPQDWSALQASLLAAFAEQAQSYTRQFMDIASSAQAECLTAGQARYEEQNRRVRTLVDELVRSAPAGSEALTAAWKSAITSSNTWSESLRRSAQQTAELAASNFKVVTAVGSKAAARADQKAL